MLHPAENLFDQAKPGSLGLTPIGADHVFLYRAEEHDFRFCHHPSLAVFRDQLICAWSNGTLSEDDPGQRILISRSSDGREWSAPTRLAEPEEANAGLVAAGFHVDGETLVAYYSTTYGDNFAPAVHLSAITSHDGKTWSLPRRIADGFFIEGPRSLASGRLVMGGETVGPDRDRGHQARRMRILISDAADGLAGWRPAAITPADPSPFQYTEPNLLIRPDGQPVIGFRSLDGWLYATTSNDGGESWEPPGRTDFPDSTSRFHLRRLPDGRCILINNSSGTQYDRSVLALSISDDGITYDRAYALRSEAAKQGFTGERKVDGWQYPHSVVWNDSLFVVYSVNKEDIAVSRVPLSALV